MTVRELRDLFRLPVVVAPMAGGPSNPALVATAAQAGAIGFLAGGYKAASAVVAEIAEVRAATAGPFGVNLFVPGDPSSEPERVAAQCGTAFLRCPESGAHPAYKAALASSRYRVTAVTRAFSGRPARGLLNQFMLDHADAPAAYPEINNATRGLRAAAARAGDTERMSLWAGQGFRSATDRPAAEVIEMLAQ